MLSKSHMIPIYGLFLWYIYQRKHLAHSYVTYVSYCHGSKEVARCWYSLGSAGTNL